VGRGGNVLAIATAKMAPLLTQEIVKDRAEDIRVPKEVNI